MSSTVERATQPSEPGLLAHIRNVLMENPVTLFAAILFVAFLLIGLFGPWIVPYSPLASDTAASLQAPSAAHWFGTDQLGRDIFSRVMVATRLDLTIAIVSVVSVFAVGGLAGILAGFSAAGWTR